MIKQLKAFMYREFLLAGGNNLIFITSIIYLLISVYTFNSMGMILRKIDFGFFIREVLRISVFFIPVLTMNSVAKDRFTGELEILSVPAMNPYSYIHSKVELLGFLFFGFSLFMLFLPLAYFFSGNIITQIPIDKILVIWFGYILFVSFYICLGVFISSFCSYPATAGGITFGIVVLIFFLETYPVFFPESSFSALLKFILPEYRIKEFLFGVIRLADLFYFISFSFLFIFLSGKFVKWKKY